MTQQSGSQFEEDLTVGIDEDQSFITDSIDLLGIGGDESSPIARLKTIILSIDWEINDDILHQLDDELHDLGKIWAGDKIKQVYVQGLSKIGKYIYKEKAAAHPNSIKLLITFYHNLEKIVTNEDTMGEDEKKQLLLADVKKFDQLKSQIGQPSPQYSSQEPAIADSEKVTIVSDYIEESDGSSELKTLKALVLGIDWEINDREMQHLANEVDRLEGVFSQNKAKLILLQGIGALSSYINKKRSQSNPSVFPLLHSFYTSLEKINITELSSIEEKKLLLSEVSKFNEFKIEIAKDTSNTSNVVSEASGPVAVMSDSPASLSHQDTANEPEFNENDAEVEDDVNSRLASVFGDEGEDVEESSFVESDVKDALAGVDVETDADDDSDEEALPYADGTVAPALADVDEDPSFSVEKLAEDLAVAPATVQPEAIVGDDIEEDDDFSLEDVGEPETEDVAVAVGSEEILQGVAVETDADDDTDEESLPMEEGELAPALSDAEDNSGFNADNIAAEFDKSDSDAIESRLGSFFDDDVATTSEGWVTETSEHALDDYTTGTDVDDEVVSALSDADEEATSDADEIESRLGSFFDEEVATSSESWSTEDSEGSIDAIEPDKENVVAALSDAGEEETSDSDELESRLGSFFDDADDSNESKDDHTIEFDDDNVVAALSDVSDEIRSDSDELESRLGSFFDDTDDSQQSIDTDTIEPDDDNVVAALSDVSDEITSDTDELESRLGSFFDDTDDSPQSIDRHITEPDEDNVAAALSDVSDDITSDSDELESRLGSFFDDTDDGGKEVAEEEKQLTVEEEALAFFDDDDSVIDENVENVIFTEDEEIAFEVETDDVAADDEIEFSIPGEAAAPLAAVLDGTDEVVVFEVVGDDVELDLLPGEEYEDSLEAEENIAILTPEPDDSLPAEEDIAILTPEYDDSLPAEEDIVEFSPESDESLPAEEDIAVLTPESDDSLLGDEDLVQFLPVVDSTDTGRYESLAILVATVQDNVEDDVINDIFTEVNRLRSDKNTSFSDKTFLQLLTTVSQYIEHNRDDLHALGLMQEIVSGLEMSASGKRTINDVQEKLFTCTSQILLLQTKEKSVQAFGKEEVTANDEDGGGAGTSSYHALGKDEQLASFVHQELSDIRKLFVEEIGNLRKELSEKK